MKQRNRLKVGKVTGCKRELFRGGNDKDLWDGGHLKKAEIYSGVIFILLTAINSAVNAIDFRW
jgi:sulfur transfer protein SufE